MYTGSTICNLKDIILSVSGAKFDRLGNHSCDFAANRQNQNLEKYLAIPECYIIYLQL